MPSGVASLKNSGVKGRGDYLHGPVLVRVTGNVSQARLRDYGESTRLTGPLFASIDIEKRVRLAAQPLRRSFKR